MRTAPPYWRSHKEWVCQRHLPSTRLPAGCKICWYGGCPSVRPPMAERPSEKTEKPKAKEPIWTGGLKIEPRRTPTVKESNPRRTRIAAKFANTTCAWKECDEQAREKSVYCSRNCSNKNARWRHKQRKQKVA